MDDVVKRLRAGLEAGAIDLADIMDAADEIERLRHGTAILDNCVTGNQPEIPCPVTEPLPVVLSGSGSVTPVPYAKHDEKRVDWHTAGGTNHDAVPEARAACEDRQPQAAAALGNPVMASNAGGTGNTPEPVAWAVVIPLAHGRYAIDDFFVSHSRAAEACDWRKQNTPRGAEIVALYRQPQPTLTDAEREDIACAESRLLSMANGPRDEQVAATLRGLLERTK